MHTCECNKEMNKLPFLLCFLFCNAQSEMEEVEKAIRKCPIKVIEKMHDLTMRTIKTTFDKILSVIDDANQNEPPIFAIEGKKADPWKSSIMLKMGMLLFALLLLYMVLRLFLELVRSVCDIATFLKQRSESAVVDNK